MKITVRAIQVEDAGAIARIIRDVGWFEHLSRETEQTTEERVRRHIALCLADRSHSSYVAEDEVGRVVGYASVHYLPYFFLLGPEGYVSELFVDRESRGRGAGTALLNAITEEARRRGCSRLSLINSRTRESYKRRYYEQRKWKERPEVAAFVLPLTLPGRIGTGDAKERPAGDQRSDIE
jgi:GNAT superfamily N-acetyltransferase